jgi:Flp pilus assembly protein TadG
MLLRPRLKRRRGIAAVELALIAPVLVVILLGLWEVGRMVDLQQILSNSAREGARLAAQGQTINSTGSPTQIQVNTGTPCVKTTVVDYLQRAGLNVTSSDVTVAFAFITGDTSGTEPYQGAKGQQFTVTVTVPTTNLRWTPFAAFTPAQMTATVTWTCLVDDPFTLDPTLPSW